MAFDMFDALHGGGKLTFKIKGNSAGDILWQKASVRPHDRDNRNANVGKDVCR